MHNRALHDTLVAFVEEAAFQLAAEVADGAEVPFELIEQGRASAPLYCYRPLTGAFIARRIGALGRLPSYPAARSALAGLDGLGAYLAARGERPRGDAGADADAALPAFLTAVWADASDFVFEASRFQPAYAELESAVYSGRALTHVLAPVEGLAIETDRIELGGGLALVRPGALRDAPEDLGREVDTAVAELRTEVEGLAASLEQAGRRLRRLQTALRLWDDAEPALAPGAWARTDGGPWLHVPLGTGTRRREDACLLHEEDEDPLRAFCALVDRRMPRSGELAWALRRFELGCERSTALDALTDWLLSARALLADPGAAGYDGMAERLAAICARPADRDDLIARVERVIGLERAAVAGLVRPERAIEELVDELAGHLRAVLRDVLCGHLDPDLRRTADELLEQAAAAS